MLRQERSTPVDERVERCSCDRLVRTELFSEGLDEIHSEVAARIIARNTRSEPQRREVLGAARKAADAYWGFLDGVQDAYMA